MEIYQLAEYLDPDQLTDFISCVDKLPWNYGAPGGFVTNSPNRQVNAYGTGGSISADGSGQGCGWPLTHWTAKMSQSNVTLSTPTEPIPAAMCAIIPTMRLLFQATFPDAQITDYTFNIAVCNHYTDPTMTIADHTDDNQWYPSESSVGPVFASVTLYPDGEPTCDEGYARFQIRPDDKWVDVRLPHASVMIMPSGIRHRVLATRRSDQHQFRPRINITFRSTFPMKRNPLMNAMATANHARYYRIPSELHYPDDVQDNILLELLTVYNEFCETHGKPHLTMCIMVGGRAGRLNTRKRSIQEYHDLASQYGWDRCRIGVNVVTELVQSVCHQCSL